MLECAVPMRRTNTSLHRIETAFLFRQIVMGLEFSFLHEFHLMLFQPVKQSVLQTLRYAPGLQNGGAGFVQRSAEGSRTCRMKLTKNLQVIRRPHYV